MPAMAHVPNSHQKPGLTQSEAVVRINEAGFFNVADIVQHGRTWHATAADASGAEVKIVVDGNGAVHQKDDIQAEQPDAGQGGASA